MKKKIKVIDKKVKKALEDALNELYRISREKGLMKYARGVQSQFEKFEQQADMMERMVKDDAVVGSGEEIAEIITGFMSVFKDNINCMSVRIGMMEKQNISIGMSVGVDRAEEIKSAQNEHIEYLDGRLALGERILAQMDALLNEFNKLKMSTGKDSIESMTDYIHALRDLNEGTEEERELKALMEKYQ